MTRFPFLKNYTDWRVCIERSCGIPLTKNFIESRLKNMVDLNQEETQRFIQRYGQDHYQTVLQWFRTAHNETEH